MKKKLEVEDDHKQEVEVIKAVAQAWFGHSGRSRTAMEFDARRRNFKGRPSRFKLEAMNKPSAQKEIASTAHWDFRQSLWDSYELVTLTKKLETGLLLDNPFTELDVITPGGGVHRKRKESKNSLRNLFNRLSSRRFNEADIPHEESAPF